MTTAEADDHLLDEIDEDFEDEDPGDECGRWLNGRLSKSCALAGTEWCDFECPYRETLFGRPKLLQVTND